jgi:hypothetical protein
MPNDCYNRLILRSTDNTKIEEAIAAFKEGTLLNYFVPQPADIEGGWYNWNYEHWGTKWDIYDQFGYKRTKTAVEFEFNTAWAPPYKAYKTAIKDHGFELELEYHEPMSLGSGYWFPKRCFDLDYRYAYSSEVELIPNTVWEALRRIWIGLGDDEEIIASEEINATRTWSDFEGGKLVDDEKKDLFKV